MNLKAEFIQQLRSSFKGLATEPLESAVADNLLSPFTIELPKAVLQQAQDVVSALFDLRERKSYQTHYEDLIAMKGLKDPGNKSILMSYDFHVDEQQNLKLIEINTNASFLALGHEMYKAQGLPLPVSDFSFDEIRQNILTEMKLQGKDVGGTFKVAITDDKPSEQRLFVEFLVYNELFKSWGWDSRIVDYRDLFKGFDPDFIYNRYTDFFLSDESSELLLDKFLSRDVCLSPNPYEYLLLADKQRLIEWSQEGFFEAQGLSESDIKLLRTAVPRSYDVTKGTAEEIWALRKKLFFKPKNAFGSKQSYKGSSISRKTFDDLLKEDIIGQEYVPAPEQVFETPEGPQSFKYDLRCYAYQGRLQLIVARLYQGQVTNLRTPYGGFGCVLFK
ncbi:hypothetical protein [Bdellovibrio svalbardensis]|uniref:Glutathionylspermidine synthase pre-ATP-grasp-like domain-containing protein n=1 Tax=Bdellovibrio svalbardensis TaxID=2972972 RepID=A0ABT6DH59_9BACT|nr:hypothetical protein [Bdellovibrio svalbardensis]MDG0815254.1 hypothetical protein [Bdellovibrio svalbardensis]